VAEQRALGRAGEPPLLLAIESATRVASVALLRGSQRLAQLASLPGQPHAERLLPMLGELLAGQGVALAQIDAFAVSIGPGSFTSLRIGLATVKGLAFRSEKPVVAVSTLEALALVALQRLGETLARDRLIVPLLDAGRGEVYAAAYRVVGETLEAVWPAGVQQPEQLASTLNEAALCVGEGAEIFRDAIEQSGGVGLRCESSPCSWPQAGAVGLLAARALARGEGESAERLVPCYLRRAQAELPL
jgi:tRNA threonylcarbamoyladenosine biosynthesis protein TsaB